MQNVPNATPDGPSALRGRTSATRKEWEAAREADAVDLNRFVGEGGVVETYVVPLWSNGDAERCLAELRGFDEVRVYVVPAPPDDPEPTFAAVAEADWAGLCGEGRDGLGPLVHAAASLDLPLLLPDLDPEFALRTLALAIAEDLSPREIGAVLKGERTGEPDAESFDRARDLLALGVRRDLLF